MLAAVGSPDGYVDCARGGGGRSTAPAIRGHDEKAQQQRRPLLPMVDACIRESQRLYPVAPFVVRHLSTDLRLKDGEEGEAHHCIKSITSRFNGNRERNSIGRAGGTLRK